MAAQAAHASFTEPDTGRRTVERRALVAEALGARAELLEVLAGLRRRVACAHINQSDAVEQASRHLTYAPRVAVEAELHALRRAAADRNVEVHLLRHVGLALLKQAVEHAELPRDRRRLYWCARLEGRSARNQQR